MSSTCPALVAATAVLKAWDEWVYDRSPLDDALESLRKAIDTSIETCTRPITLSVERAGGCASSLDALLDANAESNAAVQRAVASAEALTPPQSEPASSPLSAQSSPLSPVDAEDLAQSLDSLLEVIPKNCMGELCQRSTRSEQLIARYHAQQDAKAQECTGFAASWCPRCGDCTCDRFPSGERINECAPGNTCPLHGLTSTHADEQQPEPSKPAPGWNDDDEYVTEDGFTISHEFTDIADFIAICDVNGKQLVGIELRDFYEVAKMFCSPKQTEPSKPAPEPKQLKIWQYDLPSIKGEGWAKVIIREDGFFSAVSDWGNFAFTWGSTGPGDVREFFLRMERDWDYFASKFDIGRGYHPKTDSDASADALKREVLRLRRARELTREQAAEDWENFDQYGDDWESLIRAHWNSDDEPWRFAVFETSDAVWFVKKIGPRLVEAIRKQLADESEKETARPEPSKPALSDVDQLSALRRVNFELVTAALGSELISLRSALCGCERRIRTAFELKWANRAIHEEVDRRATLRASIRERDCNLKAVRALVNELERVEPSKPALSEVEKAAVNVVNAYHGCGDGAYDAHSLPDAVFILRDALKRIGAL